IVKQAGSPQAMESPARVLAVAAKLHEAIKELEQDEFLTGDDDIRGVPTAGAAFEEVPGFIDGLGTAGEDERTVVAEAVRVVDDVVGAGGMDLHARDEEHLGQVGAEAGKAWANIRIPLALDNAGADEACADKGGGDRPGAGGEQFHVCEQEGT